MNMSEELDKYKIYCKFGYFYTANKRLESYIRQFVDGEYNQCSYEKFYLFDETQPNNHIEIVRFTKDNYDKYGKLSYKELKRRNLRFFHERGVYKYRLTPVLNNFHNYV